LIYQNETPPKISPSANFGVKIIQAISYYRGNTVGATGAESSLLHWIALTLSTLQMGTAPVKVAAKHCCGYTAITKCP